VTRHYTAPVPPAHSSPAAIAPVPLSIDASISAPAVIDVGHPLLPVTGHWSVFGRSTTEVVRIEPASGRVTETTVPVLDSTGPVSFVATGRSALVMPLDDVDGYAIGDGLPAARLPSALNDGGPDYPGPRAGQVWHPVPRPTSGPRSSRQSFALFDLAGKRLGPTVLFSTLGTAVPDGTGNLVTINGNRVVEVTAAGTTTLTTTGSLIASGPTGWLLELCDKTDVCHDAFVDRATRTARRVPGLDVSALAGPGVISPDGTRAAIVTLTLDQTAILHVIDLVTGADRTVPVTIDPTATSGTMAWSPDNAWLLVASRGIVAVRAADLSVTTFGLPLPDVTQVTVRTS